MFRHVFKKFLNILILFLPIAFVITLLCGLIYVAIEQNFRQSANDPQIQIAEDMAGLLSGGFPRNSLISSGLPVEISSSLGAYAMVFDNSGKLLLSSGKLHGKDPVLPAELFEYAKEHTQYRLTWQPEEGVRSALVMVHYTGTVSGFVAVGRSLREVEKRENQLQSQTLLVYLVCLFISFLAVLFIWRKRI